MTLSYGLLLIIVSLRREKDGASIQNTHKTTLYETI